MGPVCWCCSKWLWTHTPVWLYSHIDTPPRWHREQTHIAPATRAKDIDQRNAGDKISFMEIKQTHLRPVWADQGLVLNLHVDPGPDSSFSEWLWWCDASGTEDTGGDAAPPAFSSLRQNSSVPLWTQFLFASCVWIHYLCARVLSAAWKWIKRGSSALPCSVSVLWIKCALCTRLARW